MVRACRSFFTLVLRSRALRLAPIETRSNVTLFKVVCISYSLRRLGKGAPGIMNKDREKKKFEEALEELEKVVERLESGELSLEDSLAAFEQGVSLVRYCNQRLNEVERKIELLVKDKEGKLQLKSLEDLEDEESGPEKS